VKVYGVQIDIQHSHSFIKPATAWKFSPWKIFLSDFEMFWHLLPLAVLIFGIVAIQGINHFI
jgi:hypothetical protein